MNVSTQESKQFDTSLNSNFHLYKQEQVNLQQCREKIVQFVDELNEKDASIREYKSSIQTSTRYISRLENINVGLKDNLMEEQGMKKKLELENRELKLKLEKIRKETGEK